MWLTKLGALGALLAVATCAAVVTPAPVAANRLAVRVVNDSIIVDGSYTVGADDGRGAIDSVRIDLIGLGASLTRQSPAFGAVLPYQFRVSPLPGSGSATYDVYTVGFAFRRGLATMTESNHVAITITDAPPPAGAMTITARKIP